MIYYPPLATLQLSQLSSLTKNQISGQSCWMTLRLEMENKPAADNSFYDICMTGGCHQGLLWNFLFIHWNIFHPKLMFAASTSAGLAGWQKSRLTEITHKQLSRWGERRDFSRSDIFQLRTRRAGSDIW